MKTLVERCAAGIVEDEVTGGYLPDAIDGGWDPSVHELKPEDLAFLRGEREDSPEGCATFALDEQDDFLSDVAERVREGLTSHLISYAERVALDAVAEPSTLRAACRYLADVGGGGERDDAVDRVEAAAVARLTETLTKEIEALQPGHCLVYDADHAGTDREGSRIAVSVYEYAVARLVDGTVDLGRDRDGGGRWIADDEHLAILVLRWWAEGVGAADAWAGALAGDNSGLETIETDPGERQDRI